MSGTHSYFRNISPKCDDLERPHCTPRGASGGIVLEPVNLHWSLKEIGGTHSSDRKSPANSGNTGTSAHFHHAQRHAARLFRRLERRNLQVRCTGGANRDRLPTISQTR
jgi:hypothetical protein